MPSATSHFVANALGELVVAYFRSAQEGNQDCRLLVPGLTDAIAEDLHTYLVRSSINSFLIVGENESPSEPARKLRAAGLTSKRIGSFVAVSKPGQLINIQDSIRGTGGTIRSLAFSEEWPWIDGGNESFRFDRAVLPVLIANWTKNAEEQEWIRTVVLEGILPQTKNNAARAHLVLDSILGSFAPSLYPNLDSLKEKFLRHSGIPRPLAFSVDAAVLIRESTRLSKRIVELCRTTEGVRQQALDMVSRLETIPDSERNFVAEAVANFLDGLGSGGSSDSNLLSFYSCWGARGVDSSYWYSLNSDRLAEIFDVKERGKATVSYSIAGDRLLQPGNAKKIASFLGERIEFDVSFQIPTDRFTGHRWQAKVLNRSSLLAVADLSQAVGQVKLTVNTGDMAGRYSKRIPLKLVVQCDGVDDADEKLDLHLCGSARPAFAVVLPGFDVVDLATSSEGQASESRVEVRDPVHIYVLSSESDEVSLEDEDGNGCEIFQTEQLQVWRSRQALDVATAPSGRARRLVAAGDRNADISFQSENVEKGEFTIEDELRSVIGKSNLERTRHLVDIFTCHRRAPYPALGGISASAWNRIDLASLMTSRIGWRPTLANLIQPEKTQTVESVGEFISRIGVMSHDAFASLELPQDAIATLNAYTEARDAVRVEVVSRIDSDGVTIEHPVYAAYPIYGHREDTKSEDLICEYLKSYNGVLRYLNDNYRSLEWMQLFVLSHLDCVVNWTVDRFKNAFCLIGPWHPLTVAKRFMVQAALVSRGRRLLEQKRKDPRASLVGLLGGVQGFRWLLGVAGDDQRPEAMFVARTSDPGWHVAFRTSGPCFTSERRAEETQLVAGALWQHFGLAIEFEGSATEELPVTCVSSYMRAFPSRRSVGVRVRRGYAGNRLVQALDRQLHAEEGPTSFGELLPGGVRLLLEEELGEITGVRWTGPPLQVFNFSSDDECVEKQHPDIFTLSASADLSIRTCEQRYELPRGNGLSSVFCQPLTWLTEGQSLVPTSVTFEMDCLPNADSDLGGLFISASSVLCQATGGALSVYRTSDLPQKLASPWVVVPGAGVDPAMLVKYVRDGEERVNQERVLWDYRIDIANRANSYFILSTVPQAFHVTVNGFFGRGEVAAGLIRELGDVGIAIGGEALKSGRHALGVVGIVGAVRLFRGGADGRATPFDNDSDSAGFLVPVDSFVSLFGKGAGVAAASGNLRSDLLAIQLRFDTTVPRTLKIACWGIESKFVTGTFASTKAQRAIGQAVATARELRSLIDTSLEAGGMPERLALLELVRFGLRSACSSRHVAKSEWTAQEANIYSSILQGRYHNELVRTEGVLVTTEEGLTGAAEISNVGSNLWIRLTKSHWPGIAESHAVGSIRGALVETFRRQHTHSGASGRGHGTWVGPPDQPVLLDHQVDVPNEIPIAAPAPLSIATTTPSATVLGEPVASSMSISGRPLERIYLGVDDGRRAVYFNPRSAVDPLDNTNLMVTGSSGTGKTQVLKYLICQIREQNKPVLILDFKNDFASDSPFIERANVDRVFVTFDGLPYNPLIPYPVAHPATGELFVQCGQHIAGVSSVLKRTYGLGAQQQAALKNAIVDAFSAAGIATSGSSRFDRNLRFPDFSAIGATLEQTNSAAFNRLDPLFTLGLFKQEFESISFQSLVGRSAVLDLSQIPSDELKNTLAQLVVLSAHAYFNSQPHSGAIRQVLVFDEAHRVLTSDYMLRLVRECRAYGVATMLSSQYPTDFPPEVSASMATKIIHGNGRDLERVKSIVQLIGCTGREGDVANLDRFQAFVDNRHYPQCLVRLMNYPLFLVWSYLKSNGSVSREELSSAPGYDPQKLPVVNAIRQLERLGLAEEKDGRIDLLELR
jgi:hypothetical protein